jgi:hypothetical protein
MLRLWTAFSLGLKRNKNKKAARLAPISKISIISGEAGGNRSECWGLCG